MRIKIVFTIFIFSSLLFAQTNTTTEIVNPGNNTQAHQADPRNGLCCLVQATDANRVPITGQTQAGTKIQNDENQDGSVGD